MKVPVNILVVEDCILNFTTFKLLLKSSNLNISSIENTQTLKETILFLNKKKPDIIFLDLNLPDCSGLESFKPLKAFTSQIATVVHSSHNDINTSIQALSFGAQDYLVKDNFDINTLDKTILFSIARKKAEVQALLLEERYRQIFYENSMPMFIVDAFSNNILECNNAAVKEYGYSRDEFFQLNLSNIWINKNLEKAIDLLKNEDINSKKVKKIQKHRKQNGELIFVNSTICDVEYQNKLVRQIQVENVTPQIVLQQALKKEQQEKESHIRKAANDAQEKERLNIGTELHENINQILAASLLYLDNFVNSERVNLEMATECKQHISTAMKEVKSLARNLIPPAYLEEDFIGSINEILIPIKRLKTIHVTSYIANSLAKNLNKQQKLAIFRIIQEQINNVVKHSNATSVTLKADILGNQLSLVITDNGRGCTLKKPKKGLGLQNIISRAELFNGTTKFVSEPEKGFEMLVTFKLS